MSKRQNEQLSDAASNTHLEVKNTLDKEQREGKKKKRKKPRTKDVDPTVLKVRRDIQLCCASNNWTLAYDTYKKAVQQGIRIETQTFSNLLSLCDGLGKRKVHVGTPKQCIDGSSNNHSRSSVDSQVVSSQQDAEGIAGETNLSDSDYKNRKEAAFEIKRHMDQCRIPLSETAYTALIRILIKSNDICQAQDLLKQARTQTNMKPRLRLYSSLLQAHARHGNLSQAVEVWHQLQQHGFDCTEEEYQALLECASQQGHAKVFQRVLSELANLVLVPSKKTTKTLVEWFESNHAVLSKEGESQTHALVSKLPPIKDSSSPPVTGAVQSPSGWTLSYGCKIDTTTGILQSGCLKGQSLHPVPLSPNASQSLLQMNETIVTQGELKNGVQVSEFQGGGKGKKRFKSDDLHARQKHWNAFKSFCSSYSGWDVVLDGANIGYYQQNFSDAPRHVDYQQIDWIVSHFQSLGKRVLLVLHQRHFSPQLLPDWAKPIAQKWEQWCLYKTPFGSNDDWFWFHAALSCNKCLLVTNDEMRDHSFQIMTPNILEKWRERHQVRFSFGPYNHQEQRREVMLEYPPVYSRRIQFLFDKNAWVIPLAKQGDENRFLDGAHTAHESEPEEELYLCIGQR